MQGSLDVFEGSGMHLVCYCDDCRAYAHAIGRADILDENGGTELFPTTPSRVSFASGMEQVQCLRLSDRGMLRWYSGCCSTPIANTMTGSSAPFVSIFRVFMDIDDDSVLGPITRVQARFALGVPPPDAERSASVRTMLRTVRFLLGAWLRGQHEPNPLFPDGRPVVTPRVLTTAERDALRSTA
jgi:hypothetical protein